MISRILRRVFAKPTTPPPRPDRDTLRTELVAALNAAIDRARSGLSQREIAAQLEQQASHLLVADAISRPAL